MRTGKKRAAPLPRFVSAATDDLRPPPALTHGLTSRHKRDALREDVETLVPALIGAAYPDPPVVDAARAAAEAILHLHQVRQAKLSLIDDLRQHPDRLRGRKLKLFRAIDIILDGNLRENCKGVIDQAMAYVDDTDTDDATDPRSAEDIFALILAQAPRELHRITDYERRGISRRARALRRLAFERIEAERRRQT